MRLLIAVVLLCFTLPSWAETPIAYWAQNSNQLPNGTNGFTPSSFPQQADVGEGLLYLQNFDQELDDNGVYRTLASFAGSTQNRLDGYPAGQSLSIVAGSGLSNNGAQVIFEASTVGFQDIRFSYGWRSTNTGFDTRILEWSTDGVNYQEFAQHVERNNSFISLSYDLSDVTELNDQDVIYIRVTFDGATAASGNNRLDNILISGVSFESLTRMTVYNRDFADDPFARGWSTVTLNGTDQWSWDGSFANVNMSSFVGGSCRESESWMISPAFNLDNTTGERVAFDVARGFAGGTNSLEVYYSTSYDGSGVIDQGEWTLLAEITRDDFTSNNVPTRFGDFEALQQESGEAYIAFRYAFDEGNCSTWRLANFEVTADVQNNFATFQCGSEVNRIHQIQGAGFQSPMQGAFVQVEAIVIADFQDTFNGGLGGFYLQEADQHHDDNPLTSEGVFVYDNGFGVHVGVGDRVRVAGTVSEFFGHTQIQDVTDVAVCGSYQLEQVTPVAVELPVDGLLDLESVAGMLVTTSQELTVSDVFNVARFGEFTVSNGRLFAPTQVAVPGDDVRAQAQANTLNRLIIDNARGGSYRTPFMTGADNVSELSATNPIRNGFLIESGFEAVMGYAFGAYRLRSENTPRFVTDTNPRTETPELKAQGDFRVATYNVENLFATLTQSGAVCGPNALGCRGATNVNELERQLAKVSAAIIALQADVIALTEIENDATDATLAMLVERLNAVDAHNDWAYLATGYLGTDAIKPAFIFRSSRVELLGDYAVLTAAVDPDFDDSRQRPALAQTFVTPNGFAFTAVAVHLRAKSSCPSGSSANSDNGDGQGCWNEWRTKSAGALDRWLATDPTATGVSAQIILGDFNAYAMEDPLTTLMAAGWTNLAIHANDNSPEVYSYTFMGEAGSLDHAFANADFLGYVLDARSWKINADETPAFGYSERLPSSSLWQPAEFYSPDAFASSDHDPLVIELNTTFACAPGQANRPAHPRGKALPLPNCRVGQGQRR